MYVEEGFDNAFIWDLYGTIYVQFTNVVPFNSHANFWYGTGGISVRYTLADGKWTSRDYAENGFLPMPLCLFGVRMI